MPDSFDVLVIGGGPGGYIAAIRAAQLGFSSACIDDWSRADGKPAPGGTCTNVGCIPSKALLQSSEYFEHAGPGFAEHGIGVGKLTLDLKQMLLRKDKVVGQNNDGILYLFKKNKVTFFHGLGSFVGGTAKDGWRIKVEGKSPVELIARNVVIATGSNPRPLPGVTVDNKLVLDNAGALALPAVPASSAWKWAACGAGWVRACAFSKRCLHSSAPPMKPLQRKHTRSSRSRALRSIPA